MRDGAGGMYAVDRLAQLLVKDDYEVKWKFVQAKELPRERIVKDDRLSRLAKERDLHSKAKESEKTPKQIMEEKTPKGSTVESDKDKQKGGSRFGPAPKRALKTVQDLMTRPPPSPDEAPKEIEVEEEVEEVIQQSFVKNGGDLHGAYDSWAGSSLDNVQGLTWRTAVDNTHIIMGLTSNSEDDYTFANGFWVGLFPDGRAIKGDGESQQHFDTYKIADMFRIVIESGEVKVYKNDELLEVLGDTPGRTPSLFAKLFLKEQDSQVLAQEVNALCRVTSIDFSGNEIGNEGAECLAKAMTSEICKVVHLDLSLNRIQDEGVEKIADFLDSEFARVQVLKLNHNEIGDKGVDCLAKALFKSKDRFELPWHEKWAKRLQKELTNRAWTDTEDLVMTDSSNTRIDIFAEDFEEDEDLFPLHVRKAGSSTVTRLELNDNNIGDPGARSLAEALEEETCQVSEVELTINHIGDEGAIRLAEAIEKDTCSIRSIRLELNKYEKAGRKRIAKAFASQLRYEADR